MTNPAVSIALLILTLFAIFGLVAWFMKDKVHTFVRALSVHRERKREGDSAATTAGDIA
ncbi:hypothetical protein LCI18_007478 [Fusarium solani-melongenae]|uniref:Uncharacterized protein n=1 Tax=Fusarium solani subsp. cucurbitae TaxID=2747967 RepID=A0ACD3Z8Z0_FUSSC|nr:hypothetical protein LCI18_007478 [Fusarium solani-melongenae]